MYLLLLIYQHINSFFVDKDRVVYLVVKINLTREYFVVFLRGKNLPNTRGL